MGLIPLVSKETFRDLICVSGSLLTILSLVNVCSVSPKTVLVPSSKIILRVHVSALGLNVILPLNVTILNGLTFSTLDASGCSSITTSS